MNSKLKKRLIWIVGVLVLLFITGFVVNYKLKNKLKIGLQHLSENIKVDYKDLCLNMLTGNVELKESTVTIYGKTTDSVNLKVEIQDLSILGFSYWCYFINGKIALNQIVLTQPNITYFHNPLVENRSYNNIYKSPLKQDLEIGRIDVMDGELGMYNASNDSLLLKTEAIQFNIKNILITKASRKPEITYDAFNVKTGQLFYALSPFENLILKTFDYNAEGAKIRGIAVNTKYSKETLISYHTVERDHFNLNIDSIDIKHPKVGFEGDTLFYFKSPLATVYQANFNVFRNKLLLDDITYRPLYSKMLRELNFKLGVDVLNINNSSITYTEKVKTELKGGELVFNNLNSTIKNIGNTYKNKTSINIDAVFIKNTPLNVQWDFDVNNQNDAFVFKSEIGNLQAEDLNPFIEPNLNVRFEGEFNKMYFTMAGNENTGQTDLKVDYNNFDVILLKENGSEKNKLLSAVLNIFISKHSKSKNGVFRYGESKSVERDKSKSVFNFVWLSLRDALLEAITGNGKKSGNN
ncbi:MAG: hypothetical protein ABJM36_01965 [Algibacter sp.]|uniref:hypothetical protein n=1 Tax=Algibacter sp. TaxID=1872428 RepID=UPI003297A54A